MMGTTAGWHVARATLALLVLSSAAEAGDPFQEYQAGETQLCYGRRIGSHADGAIGGSHGVSSCQGEVRAEEDYQVRSGHGVQIRRHSRSSLWSLHPVMSGTCRELCEVDMGHRGLGSAGPSLVLALAPFVSAVAQEEKQERSIGLPSAVQWTFNLDASVSFYSFGHSLYTNPRNDASGDMGSRWLESFARPALSAAYPFTSSELFGKLSVVGERTTHVGKDPETTPELVGGNEDSFYPDDLYLGWRSGTVFSGLDENAVEIIVGRAPYQLGHGFLLHDGASEGGSRGGYWSNARKAFAFAGIARLISGTHTLEAFYLDRDELPEVDTKSRVWGGNYELSVDERLTLGVTYMRGMADDNDGPTRNGLNVYDFRMYSTPLSAFPLSLEVEYAMEENRDQLSSNGWYGQVSYELKEVAWEPRLSYRYALFQGDDPNTARNESFDPLFLGFNDWGEWWQGEIAGEYFLSNSNLKSHQIRLHSSPNEAISTGLIGYIFRVVRPAALQQDLTADDVATEIDWYTDWQVADNFTTSIVLAWASPGEVVKQLYDRTKDFTYVMLYIQYSY